MLLTSLLPYSYNAFVLTICLGKRIRSPRDSWELNEKVIDYIFFSNEDIDNREDSGKSFERMSKYNLIRGEAFIRGECVSIIEDSGLTNVEQVITRLLSSLSDVIPRPFKVQIKITNLDKRFFQLYQRMLQ